MVLDWSPVNDDEYREEPIKLPKMFLESYRNLVNAFLVSFQDYEKFTTAVDGFDLDLQKITVVAVKELRPGQLWHIDDDGNVREYKLNDFIYRPYLDNPETEE